MLTHKQLYRSKLVIAYYSLVTLVLTLHCHYMFSFVFVRLLFLLYFTTVCGDSVAYPKTTVTVCFQPLPILFIAKVNIMHFRQS